MQIEVIDMLYHNTKYHGMKKILFSDTINHILVWVLYFFISWSFYGDYLPLHNIIISSHRLFVFNCFYIGLFIPTPYLVIYLKKKLFATQQYVLFFVFVTSIFVVASSLFALLDRLFLFHQQPAWFFTFGHLMARIPYLIILSLIINWIQIRSDYHKQKQQQEELEKLKNEAELNMLIAQISPHFLFNALNNLNSLIHTNSEKASNVIVKLSDLLRYVIYEGKKDKVFIKDEIVYIENYISLNTMKKRIEHKITFKSDIKYNAQIQPLIFINFIENAIKHGSLENEMDLIKIELSASEKMIEFICVNSIAKNSSKDKTSGIGIENIKGRLKALYPNTHQLTIDVTDSFYKVKLNLEL
jgi:sensor histidine kinase YesM